MNANYGLPLAQYQEPKAIYSNNAVEHLAAFLATRVSSATSYPEIITNTFGADLQLQDGITYSGYAGGWNGGFSMSVRDLARIAYLMLRGGRWRTEQIVDAEFVSSIFQNQNIVPPSTYGGPNTRLNQVAASRKIPGHYSYFTWVLGKTAYMNGYLGVYAIIIPELNAILVTNGRWERDGNRDASADFIDAMYAAMSTRVPSSALPEQSLKVDPDGNVFSGSFPCTQGLTIPGIEVLEDANAYSKGLPELVLSGVNNQEIARFHRAAVNPLVAALESCRGHENEGEMYGVAEQFDQNSVPGSSIFRVTCYSPNREEGQRLLVSGTSAICLTGNEIATSPVTSE